jgi:NAD(P)-dependent dehydrogenase (short-subunit alcohol dehydrogenase family)
MKEFADKVAVVTGAAAGIGRALAERFAGEGMRVVLADVEGDALDLAVKQLEHQGAQVVGVHTDVSSLDDVERLRDETLEAFGAVHLICNNAGIGSGSPLIDTP